MVEVGIPMVHPARPCSHPFLPRMGTVSHGLRRVRSPDGRRGYVEGTSPSCRSGIPRASPWTPPPCPEARTRDHLDAAVSRGLDRHTAALTSPVLSADGS